jgi:hypothetical protein
VGDAQLAVGLDGHEAAADHESAHHGPKQVPQQIIDIESALEQLRRFEQSLQVSLVVFETHGVRLVPNDSSAAVRASESTAGFSMETLA